ncbi:helix-turn-helix domain-containing protein [Pseudomonas sp. R5(2019)]|nr:helix-turn-helix domain-containing protein [Pseudomonas sp. R5(2019)]
MDHPVDNTLPMTFVQGLLQGALNICSPADIQTFVSAAGIANHLLEAPGARVTYDQFVRLYQQVALGTDDEVMGQFSRRIRSGTLKYLCSSLLDARSLSNAMYRFTRFWNLLLDDYRLDYKEQSGLVVISLEARDSAAHAQRFGHELMMKLAHGVASWLAGQEIPLHSVMFSFARPVYASEYMHMFPAPISFDQPCTALCFDIEWGAMKFRRSKAELLPFLQAAPRYWLFTTLKERLVAQQVRQYLLANLKQDDSIQDAANALLLSTRTLTRRLKEEGTSYQLVKDALRRDIAVQQLIHTDLSITHIAAGLGFDSTAVFHRAFRGWTGSTPGAYRRPGGAF